MEKEVKIFDIFKANNKALYQKEWKWLGDRIKDFVEVVTEIKVEPNQLTDDEITNLFKDGRPKIEVYYEDGKVANIKKIGTW